ncbi:helix-turn-helix transcriptional regulator [Caballeronia sp. dw_19]|uniref:helix-turn-helix domain-containing protein n=1 Tax=Caballeronia sp. dw_19 TaxID=2719791 RepID=UPI001C49F8B1|nr:helix-turn-helix transcriptional regulator [Caballeronia sp. dw_19]
MSIDNQLIKEFGAQIRYLRTAAGLSQEEFADTCGLDRTYIGGIERGERNPSLKNILRIADALNVPVRSLFECELKK